MQNEGLKKNSIIEVTFIDLSFQGLGVAKYDGFAIFVEGALPTEVATIQITKVEKRYAFGVIVELKQKSIDRVEVKNKALNSTIPLQHLSYEKQLVFKSKIVRDTFYKRDIFKNVKVLETLGSSEPWQYRNKTQVPVRSNNGKMETGIFSNRSHTVIPINDFQINLPEIDEMVMAVKEILTKFGEKPYDEKTHTGNIRHIIVRKGYYTKELMILIVTRSKSLFPTSKIIPAIIEKFPNTVSIIHNINSRKTSLILGDSSKVIYGKDYYTEEILNKAFFVSANSFLQVNTKQAEALYTKAIDMLDLQGNETVLDAYCGIGTISLSIADKVKEVVGIEVVDEAVEMAKKNASKNNVNNVSFVCGLVEEVTNDLAVTPDVVVVDPPRKGLEETFINYLIELKPKKIAYISCNPITLAKDLSSLVEVGYNVSDIQPVDMFPHTQHVECVCLLNLV